MSISKSCFTPAQIHLCSISPDESSPDFFVQAFLKCKFQFFSSVSTFARMTVLETHKATNYLLFVSLECKVGICDSAVLLILYPRKIPNEKKLYLKDNV